jgi:hypothetical protein
MLPAMTTKNTIALIVVLLALLAGMTMIAVAGSSSNGAVPAAGLRAADQFAADYTNPDGVDSNNRITDGNDTTPALAGAIAKTLANGNAHGAGFTATGPAVDSGASPNVIVPTNQGPWRIEVVEWSGRWLVSKA